MKLSEFKNKITNILRERSVNAISKAQQKNLDDISKALEFFKKNKHTDKKEAFIKVLKKLGVEKLKLAKELDARVSGMYKDAEYKGESVVNEAAGKEAMGIAAFTGTRGKAVQKFIDDYNLDARKLFNFVKKGNLKAKMEFVAAIAGKPGNMKQGKIVGMFGESVNEEDGLWANIRAKKARGEKPAHKNSKAHKDAVKAGNKINKKESVVSEDDTPCWDTHKVGNPKTKISSKTGKRVNNCVPK